MTSSSHSLNLMTTSLSSKESKEMVYPPPLSVKLQRSLKKKLFQFKDCGLATLQPILRTSLKPHNVTIKLKIECRPGIAWNKLMVYKVQKQWYNNK